MTDELWLCKVKLKYTTHMVLRFDGVYWWQYISPCIRPDIEGWVGVNFEFEPIKKID